MAAAAGSVSKAGALVVRRPETAQKKPLLIQGKIYVALQGDHHPLFQTAVLINIVISYADLREIAYPRLRTQLTTYRTELTSITDLTRCACINRSLQSIRNELAGIDRLYTSLNVDPLPLEQLTEAMDLATQTDDLQSTGKASQQRLQRVSTERSVVRAAALPLYLNSLTAQILANRW